EPNEGFNGIGKDQMSKRFRAPTGPTDRVLRNKKDTKAGPIVPRTSSPIPGKVQQELHDPLQESLDSADRTVIPRKRIEEFTPNVTQEMNREAKDEEERQRTRIWNTKQAPKTKEIWKEKAEVMRLLDKRIEKFKDGKTSDLKAWLEEFSKLLFRLDIPSEMGTRLLPFYLSGPALQRFNTIKPEKQLNWYEATKILMELHDCPAEKDLALQEITNISQGVETISEFAEKIRKTGAYAYENIPLDCKERLLASHFITGVNKKIRDRMWLLQSTPKTLSQAVAEAEKINRTIGLEEKDKTHDDLVAFVREMKLRDSNNEFRGKGRSQRKGRGRGNYNQFQPKDRSYQGENSNQQSVDQDNTQGDFKNQNQGYQRNGNSNRGGNRGKRWNGNRNNNGNRNQGNYNQNGGNCQHCHQCNFEQGNHQGWRNYNQNQQGGWNNQANNQFQQGYNQGSNQNWQGNQYQQEHQGPSSSQGGKVGWNSNTGRPFINSINKFLLGVMTILMLIAPVTSTKQICGFGEGGNIFVPPQPILCDFDPHIPLRMYTTNVYRQRTQAIEMEAHKCFKYEIQGRRFSFLNIYRTTEAVIGKRTAVSPDECRKTAISKKFNDVDLKEISPGIFRSDVIKEAAEKYSKFFGTSSFTTFEFTVEIGKIATLDGNHAISTLGNINCNFNAGSCQEDSSTIVWQAQVTRRECQFEFIQTAAAIISEHHIAIDEMELFSTFDTDLRRRQEAIEPCFLKQAYLTDDGHLVEFPEIYSEAWVPEIHVKEESEKKKWNRRFREMGQMPAPGGGVFEFDLGEPYLTPIVKKLFGVSQVSDLPELTNPITEPEILREIGRYNVTNQMLSDRARFYPQDRKHPNGRMLIALKAIRVAQYGERQLRVMNKLPRNLTRGESQLKWAIEKRIVYIFDKLLEREFGKSDSTSRYMDPDYDPPRFEEDNVRQFRTLPIIDEPEWQPITTTQRPIPSTTTTSKPTPVPTTAPRQRSSQIKPTPKVQKEMLSTTKSTFEKVNDMDDIPEENQNVVYETSEPRVLVEKDIRRNEEMEKKTTFETFAKVCKQQWTATSLFQTLLQIDPTAASRQLLQRKDISAKRIGEGLLISKCKMVTPDRIYWDRMINSTCFDLIPVVVNNKIWFELPGTDDLVGEAVEIPCDERPPNIRFEQNKWIGSGNQETHPQFLSRPSRKNQKPYLLPEPETFYTILNEESGVSTGADRENQNRNEDRSRKLSKRLISEGIIQDFFSGIMEKAASAGRSAKHIYNFAKDSMADGIKEAIFSGLMLTLWIVIPIGVILLIVASVYGYCQYKAHKAVGNLARDSAKRARDALVEFAHQQLINNVELQELPSFQTSSRNYQEEYPIHSINSIRVNSVTAAKLPHITVEMEGSKLEALLDTGAAVSYMPLSSVRSKIDSENRSKARTANGSPIEFLGTCSSTVKIGNYQVPHTWLVSTDSDCPAPLLIGSDIVKKINKLGHELQLNLVTKELKIGNSLININAVSEEIGQLKPITVQVTNDTSINPRTQTIVPASLQNYDPCMGKEFLIEDNQKDHDEIFMLARCLVKPDSEGKTQVQILNPSNEKIFLKKGRKIGFAGTISAVMEEDYIPSPEANWEATLPKLPQETPPGYKVSDKVDMSHSNLSKEEKEDLALIINAHEKAFVGPDGILGEYNGPLRHKIELVDENSIPKAKIYRIPLGKREEVEKQIGEMLKQKIIRPTDSPFKAPIVLVRKADKTSWRFTVDFRALNTLTKPVQSIIPNIHDILDLCAGKALYTTLDFQSGFHQIPVESSHCARTAFACHLGAFEYLRMPMGMRGSPGTFQRVMNNIIKDFKARVFVYIDDIVLTSETPNQHLRDIDEVLEKIEDVGMKLRPDKCKFAQSEIKYIGFMISKEGIFPNPEKTRAIDLFPTPKTVKQVRAFIGMCSFYRRFIENFSKIAAPIMDLTKKDTPFVWSNECQSAFEELKSRLTKNPILVPPRMGKPFEVEVDSSGKGVGAVLFQAQDQDGTDRRV
ncbi:hypothetical protein CAEBREN_30225, partial [Caenorhabditis brenneri]